MLRLLLWLPCLYFVGIRYWHGYCIFDDEDSGV